MKSRLAAAVIVTATLFAARTHAAPIAKQETVKLDRAAIVGSSVLPAGSYRIELASDPDTVKFVQAGRTVAEAPCKLGLATVIYPGNAVHYRAAEDGQSRLIKIVLADSKLAIELRAPAERDGDAAIANAADAR